MAEDDAASSRLDNERTETSFFGEDSEADTEDLDPADEDDDEEYDEADLDEEAEAPLSDIDDDEAEELDRYGKAAYLTRCRELGIVPVSQVLKYLEQDDLQVTHYGLGRHGADAVACALSLNESVTALRLGDNNICAEGAEAICNALLRQPRKVVTELDLGENDIRQKGGEAVIPLLRTVKNKKDSSCCFISTLCLEGNKLCDKVVAKLSEQLEGNVCLTYLDVGKNNLGPASGVALGQMLEQNGCLRELHLGWNSVRERGATALFEGLKTNVALRVLSVGWNGVGGTNGQTLVLMSEMLAANEGLRELIAPSNGFAPLGCEQLGEVLKATKTLTALELDQNPIGEEGARFLFDAFDENKGMTHLGVEGTNCSSELMKALAKKLQERVA